MLAAIIVQADKLIADIEKNSDADIAASPDLMPPVCTLLAKSACCGQFGILCLPTCAAN
jgi:hypothetical protein